MALRTVGRCVSVEDIVINSSLIDGGVGLAQTFVYRYEYKIQLLYGLNRPDMMLVYFRPVGNGQLADIISSFRSFTKLTPCKKGPLTVILPGLAKLESGPDENKPARFHTDAAYALKTEGRITIENFVGVDMLVFTFFDYETA